MHGSQFDTFTRSLRRTPSRRTALRTTLAGATLAAGWLVAPIGSQAAHHHQHHKHHKHHPACPACPEPPVCPSPPPPPPPLTCGEQCATRPGCQFCFVRSVGTPPVFCANGASFACADFPCADDADCVPTGRPYCVTEVIRTSDESISVNCGHGVCADILVPCGS